MKVKYHAVKRINRVLKVLFPAALITLPFIGRLPHAVGLIAIAIIVTVMALTVIWSLA